ncbi:hypothetical protein [Thermaerobacter litoralis]
MLSLLLLAHPGQAEAVYGVLRSLFDLPEWTAVREAKEPSDGQPGLVFQHPEGPVCVWRAFGQGRSGGRVVVAVAADRLAAAVSVRGDAVGRAVRALQAVEDLAACRRLDGVYLHGMVAATLAASAVAGGDRSTHVPGAEGAGVVN